MKQIAFLILLALSFNARSQNPAVTTDTSYIASNGMTFHIGDDIKIGKGTLRFNRRDYFTYIYTAPWTFPREYHLDQLYSGKIFKIKKIKTIGNDKRGHTVVLVCGSGELVNWWIEIEAAIKHGEVFVPDELKKDQ
jgi:hypothetical protein